MGGPGQGFTGWCYFVRVHYCRCSWIQRKHELSRVKSACDSKGCMHKARRQLVPRDGTFVFYARCYLMGAMRFPDIDS
jgi:hypothetical protein